MSNVLFVMTAFSNISYNREVDTDITVEEWQSMSREERVEFMTELLWEDIEAAAVDEETRDYLD